MRKLKNKILDDQEYYETRFRKDRLSICKECDNYFGEQDGVIYGCKHHRIQTKIPYYLKI